MTTPFDRPELTDAEKQAQREARDRLARQATFAVDQFVLRHQTKAQYMTPAAWTHLLVEATVGFLIAEDFIAEVEPERERWMRMELPEHLQPDVAGALAEYRRITSRRPA